MLDQRLRRQPHATNHFLGKEAKALSGGPGNPPFLPMNQGNPNLKTPAMRSLPMKWIVEAESGAGIRIDSLLNQYHWYFHG
jgi:hypothetical protein